MFKPQSKRELLSAVYLCLTVSPVGDCPEWPYGSIQDWGISGVIDMSRMFYDAFEFNQDLSKWDVSAVTNMAEMFSLARAFNQDLSKWDVSAVINMNQMFSMAKNFRQTLCGPAWVKSTAARKGMFSGSPGEIACTTTTTTPKGLALFVVCALRIHENDHSRLIIHTL